MTDEGQENPETPGYSENSENTEASAKTEPGEETEPGEATEASEGTDAGEETQMPLPGWVSESTLAMPHSPEHTEDSGPRTEWIGPYRVLSTIGEGGMGTVYLAEQEKPIRRKIAVKVIKAGMDSRAIVVRFESERQALALMDHAGIARILEAGTTESGLPYFGMEYVHGIPVTEYCDKHKLRIRERLDLFKQICNAVQHAHQKAVIHRDLKPSNILVTEEDGEPLPKIIDFGLAKAIGGHRLTEETLLTAHGAMLGTPEYMSPEQVDPRSASLDTRTDIYSLGVVLYRLLAGTLPLDITDIRAEAQRAAMEAVRLKICDEEPLSPSTRIVTSPDLAVEAAELRQIDRSSLVKRLKGDLDWITMKALEKDPERRYATAADFAADIDRYLNYDPVLASPPSRGYRLKKFVRKNVGLVVSLLTIALALVVGGVTATGFYLNSQKALRQEAAARRGEENARAKADELRLAAEVARANAERQRDEILRLSDIRKLGEYRAEADGLWPAYPERVAAMEVWLSKAKDLADNLNGHRETLLKVRSQAVTSSVPDGDPRTEADPEVSKWEFADAETQWRHDLLADLVDQLGDFDNPDPSVGLIAEIQDRLAFARAVLWETVEQYDVEWEEAIAAIQNEEDCPAYHGIQLTPQIGFVPLGRDVNSGLWEFGHLQTGSIPDRDDDGSLILTAEVGLVFVLIPGGTFWMGAQSADSDQPNYDPSAADAEGPVHRVSLDAFLISKYEMTQGQWERIARQNPSRHQDRAMITNQPLHPVEQVSWDECDRILARLDLALPTEAQWEFATRAGTQSIWSTGDDRESLRDAVNLADLAAKRAGADWSAIKSWPDLDDYSSVHAVIGSYQPNRFGLHDVHGNVWEWCRDRYLAYECPVEPGDGFRTADTNEGPVMRGGGYYDPASLARSAVRDRTQPEFLLDFLGVRPARRLGDRAKAR